MSVKYTLYIASILIVSAIALKVGLVLGVMDQSPEHQLLIHKKALEKKVQSPSIQSVIDCINNNLSDSTLNAHLIDQSRDQKFTAYVIKNNKVTNWSRADELPAELINLSKSAAGFYTTDHALYHYYWKKINTTTKILLAEKLAGQNEFISLPFRYSTKSSYSIRTLNDIVIHLQPSQSHLRIIARMPNIFFLIGLIFILTCIPKYMHRINVSSLHTIVFGLTYCCLIAVSTLFYLVILPSSIYWVISITIIFSSLSLILYQHKIERGHSTISKNIKSFLLYQTILLILFILFSICNRLVNSQSINIDYTEQFLFNQKLIGQLAILIVLCLSASLVCNKLMTIIRTSDLSIRHRLSSIFAAIITTSFLFIAFFSTSNYILFICLASITLLLLDIYQDRPSLNFTWLFTWAVIISAFLSINLTIHQLDAKLHQTSQGVLTKLTATDNLLIDQGILSTLENNKSFLDVLSPPYPFKVDLNLVSDNLQQLLPSSLKDNWSLAVHTYDNNGQRISQNISNLHPKFVHKNIIDPQKSITSISPKGHLQQIYTIQTQSNNHPNNPLTSFLVMKPKLQLPLHLGQGQIIQYSDGIPIYQSDLLLETNSTLGIQLRTDVRDDYLRHRLSDFGDYSINLIVERLDLTRPLSLFSLLITLTFIILLLSAIANTYVKILPEQLKLFISKRKSLRYKIQLTVLSSIIGSFMIIAFITLIYLRNSYQHAHLQKVETLIESFLHKYELNDVLHKMTIGDPEIASDLDNFSKIHDCKIELYNWEGNLLSRNKEAVHKINPMAYNVLQHQNRNLAILTNNSSSFLNDFGKIAYLKIKSGHVNKGILKIDSAHAGSSLSQGLSNFLSTLLNVYVFLFLIAGTVAITLANSITKPISVLGENLKNLKLGKRQEPLKWENQDELGDLIKDYNLTVDKLEESAKLLAITERESAWREMAKQVAHEIKNPLTPMKLSIQHLNMASSRAENPDIKKMISRVSLTLIEQIDALSDIASEFSNFAHFPKPENQTTVLNEVIATAHDLFRKRDDMHINLYVPIDEIYVFADKNYLLRVFNNLLKNAIQAIPNDQPGKIDIRLFKKDDHAHVEIEDNGSGIPEEMYDKVFTPNFTTKNSGTGLGLAISSNIIESFNGSIYFNSTIDKGTIFYVELPLMHKEDNFKTSNRVTLD